MSGQLVDNLQSHLTNLADGGIQAEDGGAFRRITFTIQEMSVELLSDYGRWRANIRYQNRDFAPASFWIAAARGNTEYPEPAVTDADIEHLDSLIELILENGSRLAPIVDTMGDDYERAMRRKLSAD